MKYIYIFVCLSVLIYKSTSQDPVENLENQTCEIVCNPDDPELSGLEILVNQTNKILLIINNTDPKVGLVIDAKDKSYALWNGSNGDAIIIDTVSKTGVLLSPADSPLIWDQYTKSVEEWLQTVPALKECALESTGGVHFNTSNIPPQVQEEIDGILARLLGGPPPTGSDPLAQLPLIGDLVQKVSSSVTGSLDGILSQITGVVHVPGNLEQFAGVFAVIDKIFEPIQGGLQTLLKAGGSINLQDLFNLKNVLDIITNIFAQIGKFLDPSVVMKPIFDNVTALLGFVAGIAGTFFAIVGGVVNLLVQVIATVLGVFLGLVGLIIDMGVDSSGITAKLGFDIVAFPIDFVTAILKLVPDSIQKVIQSSFKNFLDLISKIGGPAGSPPLSGPPSGPPLPPVPGLDKVVDCFQGIPLL